MQGYPLSPNGRIAIAVESGPPHETVVGSVAVRAAGTHDWTALYRPRPSSAGG
jgi:hypothetical protein